MAQVARVTRLRPDIDYHIDYQLLQWRGIPQVAEWWPTMDVVDKEVFQLEWEGITESRLAELEQWVAEGLLTPEQRARYDELLRLIEQHRPTLERLLRDGAPGTT